MAFASASMIESACRYIAILALLVRVGMSLYMSWTLRKTTSGLDAASQTPPRPLRAAPLLFMNIWVVIALTFWLTALLHEHLAPDAL